MDIPQSEELLGCVRRLEDAEVQFRRCGMFDGLLGSPEVLKGLVGGWSAKDLFALSDIIFTEAAVAFRNLSLAGRVHGYLTAADYGHELDELEHAAFMVEGMARSALA